MNKIIVLTPIKNEAWILHRFLSVTSVFADHIIIADQSSTDGSLEIVKQFKKAILIENKSTTFNEAERQILLIETARRLFPNDRRVLLALDADEIVAANSIHTEDWQKIKSLPAGTILSFDLPTLFFDFNRVLNYEKRWRFGYVDDGAMHVPSKIHSIRIPAPEGANEVYLEQVKILHYTLLRKNTIKSKLRYYSCLEKTFGTKKLHHRLRAYSFNIDSIIDEASSVSEVKADWLNGWENMGIDMRSYTDEEFYYYDLEVLKLFFEYGCDFFATEPIWNFDWKKARDYFFNQDPLNNAWLQGISIKAPNPVYLRIINVLGILLIEAHKIKNKMRIVL